MSWGASAWNLLAGAAGAAVLVYLALRAHRWPWRRVLSTAGGALLLLGLSLSGLFGAVAVTVTRLALDPLRWVGVATAVVGVLLLAGSGALRLRSGGRRGADAPRAVDGRKDAGRARPQPGRGDDDLAEIEEILRRRGIE